jgi:hypothetical protein
MQYDKRDESASYLWTFVREPTKRTISQYFFDEVSRSKKEPHDSAFQLYLRNKQRKNHYLQEMSPNAGLDLKSYNLDKVTSQILELYDFIGIVERFDESLVVLKLLLGLEYRDILYLSAKSSGGHDDGVSYISSQGVKGITQLGWDPSGELNKGTCVYIVPSFVSPGMKKWLQSSTWQNQISGGNALYASAYHSLDQTIDRLGRILVAEQLAEFKRKLSIAQETCTHNTIFPCSASGVRIQNKKTSCLVADSGCGYACFDNLTFA